MLSFKDLNDIVYQLFVDDDGKVSFLGSLMKKMAKVSKFSLFLFLFSITSLDIFYPT